MNNPENNITEQIVSGPITIESAEKFEKLLKSSSNDPALWKAFVDLLIKKGNGILWILRTGAPCKNMPPAGDQRKDWKTPRSFNLWEICSPERC